MSIYQLGILGSPTEAQLTDFTRSLRAALEPFHLQVGSHLIMLDAAACQARTPKEAFVAIYFGSVSHPSASLRALDDLIKANLPIIPFVTNISNFSAETPLALHFASGVDIAGAGPRMEGLVAATLECLGLLRRQRRTFISYRRVDSAAAALQLHEALSGAGFDVFLDTHDVRPAEDFQAVLWHRLCDSDVMVMLDTPGYFQSRWTPKEIGRALAKNIAVLSIVWPGHTPERTNQMREPIFLEPSDVAGADGPLVPAVVTRIRFAVEQLRSRSLAIRHAHLAGTIRSAVEEIGGVVEGIGAHRALSVRLPDGSLIRIFPAVGVPTAETFYDAAENDLSCGNLGSPPVLLYDHIGLHVRYQKYLGWLQRNVSVVRGLQAAEAGWELAAWER